MYSLKEKETGGTTFSLILISYQDHGI